MANVGMDSFFVLISIAVLLILVVAYVVARHNAKKSKQLEEVTDDSFVDDNPRFTSETVIQEENSQVLKSKGSEDVREILSVNLKAYQKENSTESTDEYLPDEKSDWVVSLEIRNVTEIEREEVLRIFDNAWREANGTPELYGKSVESGKWAFLLASDAPETVSQVRFAWKLYQDEDQDRPNLWTQTDLRSFLNATKVAGTQLGDIVIGSATTPEQGGERAEFLKKLAEDCDWTAGIVLKAREGETFQGNDVWDVMMSLGLQWGDMEIFHWVNDSGLGDDSFFSVWSSTSPGYFIRDQIKAGEVQVDDLVFGFAIPRCIDPVQIYDAMLEAARYAKERLGGELLDTNGDTLQDEALKKEIEEAVRQLEESGYPPGSDASLYVF